MDKKIVDFIKKYDISDLEIEDMLEIAPMLDVTTYDEFKTNVFLLVEYGYPLSDLDFLMLSNPNMFAESARDLKADLEKLKQKFGDVEEPLKKGIYDI